MTPGRTWDAACPRCREELVVDLLHRVVNELTRVRLTMATNVELRAAVDALAATMDSGFAALAETVAQETQAVVNAITAAGVEQAVIDQLVALKATLAQKVADLQADISDTV